MITEKTRAIPPPCSGITFATTVACVLCSVPLWANSLLVGIDDRTTVYVGEGEMRTQTDPVVVKPGGTLDKTGEGRLAIPTSTLRDSTDFTMNVRGGTVAFPASGAAAEFSSEPPAVIASKAAIWLDANVNVDLDGDNVVGWRDRRETQTATPYDYPRGRSCEYTSGDGYPWLAGEAGRRKVDFGGYGNGRYMKVLATNSEDNAKATLFDNFRHVFLVHEILTNACYALGCVSGVSPDGGLPFHPGSSAAKLTDAITSPGDGRKSIHGRLERNGLLIDSSTETPITGVQLYDWHFVGGHGSAKAYAGLGNFSALCNGLYAGRQGGGILSEIIAFNDWLTEEERIEIAGYLMKKWGIASDAAPSGQPQVHTAEGATVEAPVNTVDVCGEGRYAPVLSGGEIEQIDVDALTNFHGTLDLPYAQAMRTMEELPLEAAGGDRFVVTNSFEGIVLARYNDQDAGTLTKDSTGGAILRSIPAGVTNLNVNGGILRLTPRAWADTVAPGTNVTVAIKNANFEQATRATYIAYKWGSDINSTPLTYNNPSFNWSAEVWKSPEGLYPAHWLKIATGTDNAGQPTPEGIYRLCIRGQMFAYQDIEVPVDGIYELSFLAQDNSGLGGKHPVLEIALGGTNGTAEGTNMVVLAEVQSFYDRGWARYRYITPYLTAGTHHLRIGNTRDTCLEQSYVTNFDDISLRLVSRPSTAWPVPNGDFETLAHTNALPTTNMIARAAGWTFSQAAWGTDTTLPGAFVLRYGTSINRDVPICASTEHHHGHTQLALVKGSTAETTFKPLQAGIYRLRGRIGMFNIGNLNGINTRSAPLIKVTCRQGEGAEVTLDSRYAQKRTFTTVVWNKDVTFADTNTTVTLTLSNTTGNSVALIDDLEFVPAHEVREDFNAIVKNGNNFSSNWTFFNNRVEGDTKSAAVNNTIGDSVYTGHNRYRNNAYVAQIIDRGAMYQNVTFPGPGRYRLKWHARARADVRDENFTASFSYGKKSALRVVLAEGGVTNTLFEGSTATTNFVGYECSFDIADASKAYTLGFEGANDPAISGATDQNSFVSNLKCERIGEAGQTNTSFGMDPSMSIRVASGAKIELDYTGTNEIASLRFAGRRIMGVVDAQSYPLYVTGRGALYAKPRQGFIIDFK